MSELTVFLNIGGQEIIVILLIVLVLFGGRKIPELMRGLGKGVREYKKVVNGVEEEIASVEKADEKSEKTTETAETKENE